MTVMPKPYAVYKDTRMPWQARVPEHWELRRLKYVLEERDQRSVDGREPLLSVSQYTGVTVREDVRGDNGATCRAESLVGYKVVRPGDLVVNIMLAWNGSMGVSRFAGITSPSYCVYRCRAGVHSWYVHHLLRSPFYKARIKAVSSGVVDSRLRLYSDDLLRLEAVLPPFDEQAAIVHFLDYADRRIRRCIRAKRKLIRLLEEQKKTAIHRAVTRGLDPNVRLKPSGVEWLGNVPAHWEVRRVKEAFAAIVGGATPPSANSDYWDGDVVWVTPSDVSRDTRLGTSLRRISVAGLRSCSSHLVPIGSVIVTSRAPVGNVAIADTELCTNQGCKSLVASPSVVAPLYGFYVLTALREELESIATGTTFAEISAGRLGDVRMPLPPLSEQSVIARALGDATASITSVVDKIRCELALLRECRTCLISDVVTGKLDVRAAAAALPEEGDEVEPADEVESESEDGEADAEEAEQAPKEADA